MTNVKPTSSKVAEMQSLIDFWREIAINCCYSAPVGKGRECLSDDKNLNRSHINS